MKSPANFLAVILILKLAEGLSAGVQEAVEVIDYFTTNVVSTRFGQEGPDDGVKHLARQADGRTTLEELNGAPCRYLNRAADGKSNGYLYFVIHPDFKERELKTTRIDVEYRVPKSTLIRLQYDAFIGDIHKPYKSVTVHGGELVKVGGSIPFTRVHPSNDWQKATFYIADGAFKNSQNGKADFRLEAMPPEIHVRSVTVTREENPTSPSPKQ